MHAHSNFLNFFEAESAALAAIRRPSAQSAPAVEALNRHWVVWSVGYASCGRQGSSSEGYIIVNPQLGRASGG